MTVRCDDDVVGNGGVVPANDDDNDNDDGNANYGDDEVDNNDCVFHNDVRLLLFVTLMKAMMITLTMMMTMMVTNLFLEQRCVFP